MINKRVESILNNIMTIVVILAGLGLLYKQFVYQPPAPPGQRPPVQDVKETIPGPLNTNVEGEGQVAVVEFTDFQCPFCRKHVMETLPTLRRDLIGSARLRYVAYNLPLDIHDQAIAAAEAAECASDQGKFWEMYNHLFSNQKELSAGPDYVTYAKNLGLDPAGFESCLNSDRKLAKVRDDQALAARLGVQSTPTLFIGQVRADGGIDLVKRLNGAVPLETIKRQIAALPAS